MDILKYPWVKVIDSGLLQSITITDIVKPSVSDLAFPRGDLNSAVYQMLIGILQTAFAPRNHDEWKKHYDSPPSVEQLSQAVSSIQSAFHLINEQGAAFMQDFDLPDCEAKDLVTLFIEAPGAKTIKDNTDHFVKRGMADKFCSSCVTAALYCLQVMSPSGGVGHRTSIRGGGGLTSLVLPQGQSSIWQKLWLNVLPSDHELFKSDKGELSDIFPWLAETRTSEKKGSEVVQATINPLQMYWAMPRRIRLLTEKTSAGHCDVCGEYQEVLFEQYQTKNYGINYGEYFLHPLTPYRKTGDKPPLSIKGKQGGFSYRDWLGIAVKPPPNAVQRKDIIYPAAVVKTFLESRQFELGLEENEFNIWCTAYDMDNMKARCWYDDEMPLVHVNDDVLELFYLRVEEYIALATDGVSILRQSVKKALANRPKDLKGDLSKIDTSFWQQSYEGFFDLIMSMAKLKSEDDEAWILYDERWRTIMVAQMNRSFEFWALDRFYLEKDLPRILNARDDMKRIFYKSKYHKALHSRIEHAKNSNKKEYK